MKRKDVKTVDDLKIFLAQEIKLNKPDTSDSEVQAAIAVVMTVVKTDNDVQGFLLGFQPPKEIELFETFIYKNVEIIVTEKSLIFKKNGLKIELDNETLEAFEKWVEKMKLSNQSKHLDIINGLIGGEL